MSIPETATLSSLREEICYTPPMADERDMQDHTDDQGFVQLGLRIPLDLKIALRRDADACGLGLYQYIIECLRYRQDPIDLFSRIAERRLAAMRADTSTPESTQAALDQLRQPPGETRVCRGCNKELALTYANFGKDGVNKDGTVQFKYYCRSCTARLARERRAAK